MTDPLRPPTRTPPTRAPPAPWLPIPATRLITIEHPAVIRDLPRALETLGGERALSKLAATDGASGLDLRFRPDDMMQPPVQSRTANTCNVLLKVKIPRKNKRVADSSEPPESLESALQRLREAGDGGYTVEAVGLVEKTVRFRDMANYQFNTSRVPFVAKMKESLIDVDYDKLRKFELDPGRGVQPGFYVLPPPAFSATGVQHNYYYRQNPAIKKALVAGKPALLNLQAAPKTLTPMVHISTPSVPFHPPSPLPAYDRLERNNRLCVDKLRALFMQRPIWTRRALFNHLPRPLQSLVRFSMVHVAYMWRAGPWRDTCVLYGVDPRSDPKYRKFQSVVFQVETERPTGRKKGEAGGEGVIGWGAMEKAMAEATVAQSHVFDGKDLVKDGRCFQLCDVTDPLLMGIINTDRIRKKCDPNDGWYHTSTIRKIKDIMRGKIRALADGAVPNDSDFLAILERESEDEEQESVRKEREAAERAERRRKKTRRITNATAAAAAAAQETEEEDEEDEDDLDMDADGDLDGDWEYELNGDGDVPENPREGEEEGVGVGVAVDERVREAMMEVMQMGATPYAEDHHDDEEAEEEEEGEFGDEEGDEDEDEVAMWDQMEGYSSRS